MLSSIPKGDDYCSSGEGLLDFGSNAEADLGPARSSAGNLVWLARYMMKEFAKALYQIEPTLRLQPNPLKQRRQALRSRTRLPRHDPVVSVKLRTFEFAGLFLNCFR
jgi:hypothetical protein